MGRHTRLVCPNCGVVGGSKAAITNHNVKYFNCYCNACGLNVSKSKGKLSLAELAELRELNLAATAPQAIALPLGFTNEIPSEGRQWLYDCGISPTYWKMFNIGWSDATKRVVLPVYDDMGELIWLQQRAVIKGMSPKYLQPNYTKKCTFSDNRKRSSVAVIVEDIASSIRVNTSGAPMECHAIMGTSLSEWQLNELRRYNVVLIWLDPDVAGERARKKIAKQLGLLTTVKHTRSHVDPKKLSNHEITSLLLQTLMT